VSNNPFSSKSQKTFQNFLQPSSPYESLRELLESLSNEQIHNQELLVSIGFALRSFTNLKRFIELVPVIASSLVRVDGALLIPFHTDGRIWKEEIQFCSSKKLENLILKINQFPLGQEIGFASNQTHLLMLDQLIQSNLIHGLIFATSLVARGKQYGRLYVFNNKPSFLLTEVNTRHLQLIADLTAVAFENDLFIQQTRRHENVDRQLSIGAEIQAQLLPARCPIIDGVQLAACCRPAFQVGGDYFDFMPTRPELLGKRKERGRWAFVIGDVMGKGIPAGLLMTMLRGMLRAEVLSGLPPDRILHDLNQLALEDLAQSHRFVTLFYSDFDPTSRKLRFANAAHNPPLLWRFEKKMVTRLDAPGLLIGLQSDADYVCCETILEPGDVLLYYTDGVTDAVGFAGDRFNEARLITALEDSCKKCLDAKDILDKLFRKLDAFVGNEHHLEDDASIVVLKVDEELVLPHLNNSSD